MATAYSGEVNPGGSSYNRIRLRVEYSGTSATCYIEFRRTSTWTDTWSDSQASITFNGTTVSAPYSYSGTVNGDWRTIDSASGFSVSTSGGTYSWSFNNPTYGSVLGCSGTITIPAQQVAPTKPTISTGTVAANSIPVTYGTTSFGNPSTGTVYLYGGTGATPTTQINSKTTTGNSTYTHSNIGSNTKYYYRARAYNGSLWSDYSSTVNATTKAYAPTVSTSSAAITSAVIYYSAISDGGAYQRALQYSLNGTQWTTGATLTGGSAKTGTYTISSLSANTSYSIQTRVSTTAGNTTGSTLSVKTKANAPSVSVSSKTSNSITIQYSAAADGGTYNKTIQYSINGGSTWTNGATITGSAAASGSFTISGLSAYTDYTIQTRVSTTAGTTTGSTLTAKTNAIAPSGGSVTVTGTTWNTVTLSATLTSYGAPGSEPNRKIAIGVSNAASAHQYKRENQYKAVTSQTTTVNNNSIHPNDNALTLCGCTTVYPYLWATNTVYSSTFYNTTPYYLPPAPLDNITLVNRTDAGGVATVEVTVTGAAADGTHNATGVVVGTEYRVSSDNGATWTNWAWTGSTLAPNTPVNITVTGTEHADILFEARQSYQSQKSEVMRLSVPYVPQNTARLYGSVSGATKEINKLYGPVLTNVLVGVTGVIRTGATIITGFDNAVFYASASQSIDRSKTISYLRLYITDKSGGLSGFLYLYYTDETSTVLSGSGSSVPDVASYGITVSSLTQVANDYIDLTPVTTQQTATKRIVKLYGSVNGSAKLVYEDTNV